MNEREKFEKWWLCSDTGPTNNKKVLWDAWQAALSTRKPFAFGLVDKDGKPWSDCARENEDFLRQEYDHAYPGSAPFRVVELFYEDEQEE